MNAPFLRPENQTSRVMLDAIAAVETQGRKSAENLRESKAVWFANRPQFIPELIYGRGTPRNPTPIMWPFPNKTAGDLLQDCHALLAASDLAIRERLPVNTVRRINLLDAEAALLRFLTMDDEPPHTGADLYVCAACNASKVDDLPACPRATIRDCDVLCERIG